jgi:transposase
MDVTGVAEHAKQLLSEGNGDAALELVLGLLQQLFEKNSELELRMRKLLKQQFGRTSEKLSAAQLSLFLSEMASADDSLEAATLPEPPPDATTEAELPRRKVTKGHGRKPLPVELPREERVHMPPAEELACADCGREKSRLGEERSDTLEWVPGHFKVIAEVRPKFACRACESGICIAPPANRVIEGGLPGPGLLAHILVSKYRDSLPLNRLCGIFARTGVELRTSTLSDWVGGATDALGPLAEEIRRQSLAAYLLQSDDTGLRVLDRDAPNGVKRGHMWVYLGDGRWAAFVYTPNWKQDGPLSFLRDRKGWLQVDGYKGYDALFTRPGATAIEVGCWSHARRGFVDALDGGDLRAALPLQLIGRLFDIERQATEENVTPEERLARRTTQSATVIEQLMRWVADSYNREPPKSPMAKALYYVINQWPSLKQFLEDGRLPLHNNASENALRPIAVGRKNYLFAGSDAGAERAAIAYTVLSTCAINGVDPWAWTRDVLENIANGWPQKRIAELLPPNWKAARSSAAQA